MTPTKTQPFLVAFSGCVFWPCFLAVFSGLVVNRQFSQTRGMRSFAARLLQGVPFLLAAFVFSPSPALAASVYLTTTSPYASGDYTQESLEKKTTEVKTQHWYRLRLLRTARGAVSASRVSLKKNMNSGVTLAWAPEEFILRQEDLRGQCFIKRVTDLHAGPHLRTLSIGTLGHGARVSVTGPVVATFGSVAARAAAVLNPDSRDAWVPVEMGEARGFVSRADVILPEDIRSGRAMLIGDGSALRSAPLADADVIAHSRAGQIAAIIETASLRWGRVAIEDRGDLWWPGAGGGGGGAPTAVDLLKFKTAELFLHRKIHDIASSPLIPNLKILSAQGVFRTVDGDEWEKLPQFKDANYPVAITETGRIYVGTFVSDDQGETFHSFLRIENVVSPLRRRWNTTPRRMRILEINPQSADGQKLSLKIDIGLEFPVTVATSDQGKTWSAL